MSKKSPITVPSDMSNERLDVWLAAAIKITRAQVQRLIKAGAVLVNNKLPKKTGDQIKTGDVIVWHLLEKKVADETVAVVAVPDPIIIVETKEYLVLDKPAGLVVHPPTGLTDKKIITESATLAGWLVRTYPKLWRVGEYPNRPGMVHRLDKDTSGLMVIARTQAAFVNLKKQFKDRTVEKHYWALAHGVVDRDHGELDFPIGRGHDGRMVARPPIKEVTLRNVTSLQPGRTALTEFLVTRRFVNFTLLDVTLHTGRTHQIRVHFFAFNHPLVGDPLYQNKQTARLEKKFALDRVFLQAYKLSFTDLHGERVTFELPMPNTLQEFLEKIT